jgi:hypothetical protein
MIVWAAALGGWRARRGCIVVPLRHRGVFEMIAAGISACF